jgi:hypothetical protein
MRCKQRAAREIVKWVNCLQNDSLLRTSTAARSDIKEYILAMLERLPGWELTTPFPAFPHSAYTNGGRRIG